MATSSNHNVPVEIQRVPPEAQQSVLDVMKRYNIPMTREHYLGLAFGDPHFEPDAEQELDLPEQFRGFME